MPDPSNSPTPPSDPLMETAHATRSERLAAGGSHHWVSRVRGRAVALGVFRACCAGVLLAGLLPTLLILTAWVEGTQVRSSSMPDPQTPLGRDPVRWRVEKSLWYFPLGTCPLGFAVGFLAWSTVEVASRRAGPSGRVSRQCLPLVGFLVASYLMAVCVEWYSSLPDKPEESGIPIRHDPIEDDPHVQPLIRAAEQEVREELKDELQRIEKDPMRGFGFCHAYWATKKRVLKEKYGIDWRTPKEMNPKVAFD